MQRKLLCVALISLASCGQVVAEASDAAQRCAALTAIPGQINDPDPTLRLVNMEKISSTGDALAIQLAVKSALASKDPELHSLALRAYLKSQDHLQLELRLPAEIDRQLAALSSDKEQLGRLRIRLREPLYIFDETSGRLLYDIDAVDFSRGRFTVYAVSTLNKRIDTHKGNGQISGSVVSFTTQLRVGTYDYQCAVQLRPTAELKLGGEATCGNGGRFPVSMSMYD